MPPNRERQSCNHIKLRRAESSGWGLASGDPAQESKEGAGAPELLGSQPHASLQSFRDPRPCLALSRKAPRRTWLWETLLSSGSLAARRTGQDSGPASLGSRLVQDVAADVSQSSRASSRSVSAHSAAIRARPALEGRGPRVSVPMGRGKEGKDGEKDRESLACLHSSARTGFSSWHLGMPLRCQRSSGSVPHGNAPCRGLGCISPTSLLSDPCAMSALCSCAQLPAGTHGSEGAA